MTALETVPEVWDSSRDEPFFRITAHLLPSAFLEAASVLLASYDEPVVAGPSVGWSSPVCEGRLPAQVRQDDRA